MTARFADIPVPGGASPEGVAPATVIAFTEGPAAAADGSVYFSDIENNRIVRFAADGAKTVFRQPSHRCNGQTFDQAGRLYHCEGAEDGGGRRITRTDLTTGQYKVITDRYDGVRYNSPNDICLDGAGRIYFTDPRYGDRADMEMEIEGVYRIDPDGQVHRILQQPDIQRPNGIAATLDSRTLYLVDSCPVPGGNRKIWRFDLDDAGNPTNQQVLFDFAPGRGADGIRLDTAGNIYAAAGIAVPRGPHETADVLPGVYVISPAGELLGRIPVPEDLITNLAFGGSDGRTLYITAGKTLFQTRVAHAGQVVYPRWGAA